MTSAFRSVRSLLRARPWISAAVVAVLLGGSVAGYLVLGSSSGAQAQTGVTTSLSSVTTGAVSEAVSTTGTLAPADEDDVSFSSAATITSVRVAVGQHITKGAVLGTIDTTSLQATLAQARATLATAKSSLVTAQDSSSTTSAQLVADRASVTSARTSVTAAQTALTDATLRSPIAGTVAEVNVTKGDESSGSSGSGSGSTGSGSAATTSTGSGSTGSTGSGTAATSASSSTSSGDFVVIGLKKWTVSASVDDTEVGLISKGDQAQITVDSVTGRLFGVVTSVSVLSSSSSGSASYPVEISVTGSPSGLHDGSSATLSLVYKQVSNVLTVPTTAIHRSGTSSYVYVKANGAKTKQVVTTGLSSGGTTQIKSGLKSGQQVYVQTVNLGSRTGSSARSTTGTNRTRTGGGTGGFPGGGTGGFGGGGGFAGGGSN